jgi:hypothetical protein
MYIWHFVKKVSIIHSSIFNLSFKIQNINGGIFVPFGKNIMTRIRRTEYITIQWSIPFLIS